MEQMKFHKQKLYSLILAGVALISMLLPWLAVKSIGGYGLGISKNGFGGWGLAVLAGIAVVVASCFMGDKSKAYDDNSKKLALGGFGAIAGGALIYLIRILTSGGGYVKPGLGLFLGLVAGALGLLILLGMVKPPKALDDKIGGAS